MTKRSSSIPAVQTLASLGALLGVFALYVHGLPSTVQTGDTGEIVANSFLYQVAHPSGYPLLINLQYVLTHLFGFGTLFYRASFFNALFAIGALGFLSFSSRNRWFSLSVALCLAVSKIFWRYSELPDVFALNNLLAAGILFFYCRDDLSDRKRLWGASLFFFLGLSNHLTVVFLAPLLGAIVWSARDKKNAILPIVAGVGLCVSIYSSLMLMHPDRFNSWGSIRSPQAVLSHFLREDYGRTRQGKEISDPSVPVQGLSPAPSPLDSHSETKTRLGATQFTREVDTAWRQLSSGFISKEFRFYLKNFFDSTFQDFAPAFVFIVMFIALAIYDRRLDRKSALLFGTLAVYCYVIFALVKIQPKKENLEVVERFFVLAQLLLCTLVIQLLPERIAKKPVSVILALILLIQVGVSIVQNRGVNSYSENTIVEDYAINFLKTTPEQQPSILLAEDDTRYFALKYVQQIFDLRQNTRVVSAPLLFHSWYSKKLLDQKFGFSFNAGPIQQSLHFSLEEDLLAPNVDRIPFFVSSQFNDSKDFKLTYHALGRQIDAGHREFFDNRHESEFEFRSTPGVLKSDLQEYDPFRDLYSEYAYYHLARGRAFDNEANFAAAQKEFLAALQRVPYCVPAVQNICVLKSRVGADTSQCQDELKRLLATSYDYYSY